MGKADTATMAYMGQNDVFADAFNFFLYQGERVIRPEQLRELDPTELMMPYGTEQQGEPVQRYRDILKGMTAMEDGKQAYLLLGIENQTRIHYAAPVKGMLYDALQYARQVEQTAGSHRQKKEYKGRGSGEFLAGFYKEDRLLPVITLFVSFEFGQFHSSLGDVLEFIKYSGDKEKLMEWLHEEKPKLRLGRKEVEVLNTCVNAKLAIKEEEEEVEVCKASEDYQMEAVEKATKEVTEKVTKEVTKEVTQKVTKKVTKEATESTRLSDLKNLMKNMQWTANQAAAALGLSPEDTAKFLAKL